MTSPERPAVSTLWAALMCRCPRCGEGRLFDGLVSIAPRCPICGLDLRAHDVGDGAIVFVVFVLGAIVVALSLIVEFRFAPPLWLHAVLWTPIVLIGAVGLLRPLKAGFIALQYRHRALGGPV